MAASNKATPATPAEPAAPATPASAKKAGQDEPAQPAKRTPGKAKVGDRVNVFTDFNPVTHSDVAPASVTRVHGENPNTGAEIVDLHINPDGADVVARTSVHLFDTKEGARQNGGGSAFYPEVDPEP